MKTIDANEEEFEKLFKELARTSKFKGYKLSKSLGKRWIHKGMSLKGVVIPKKKRTRWEFVMLDEIPLNLKILMLMGFHVERNHWISFAGAVFTAFEMILIELYLAGTARIMAYLAISICVVLWLMSMFRRLDYGRKLEV